MQLQVVYKYNQIPYCCAIQDKDSSRNTDLKSQSVLTDYVTHAYLATQKCDWNSLCFQDLLQKDLSTH